MAHAANNKGGGDQTAQMCRLIYMFIILRFFHDASHYYRLATETKMSQLLRLWYLSHRRPAKAQASLRIRAVWSEPSLFAHMKYGSRRRIWPKIRLLALLNGCACAFEEWVYGGRKVPQSHEMAQMSWSIPKPTIWPVAQQRLRSAWAFAKSDQSLLCSLWVAQNQI